MGLRLYSLFGLLRWFFTPVKLYGGDGHTGSSGGNSETSMADAANSMGIGDTATNNETIAAWAEFNAADHSFDSITEAPSAIGTSTSTYDSINASYFDAATKSWQETIGTSVVGYDATTKTTYDSYFNEATNIGYSGYSQTATSAFGMYSSTLDWNSTEELGTRTHSVLGVEFTTDVHFNSAGHELSMTGEWVADFATEVGWDISPDTAQAMGSWVGVAFGVATGMSTQATTALGTINASIDTAVALDNDFTAQDAQTAKAAVALASVAVSVYELTTTLAALAQVPSAYMTAPEKVIMATVLIGKTYLQHSGKFGELAGGTGIDTASALSGNIGSESFGSFTKGMTLNTLDQIYDAYGQWVNIISGSSGSTSLASIQEDPFEYMAGGGTYVSQFAGGELYVSAEMRDVNAIQNKKLSISKESKFMLAQNDSWYTKLEPINTDVTDVGTSNYRAGQLSQVNRLVGEYSDLVSEYNEAVSSYNTTYSGVTYSTKEAYDSAIASSEIMKDKLDSQAENIVLAGESITSLREQFRV